MPVKYLCLKRSRMAKHEVIERLLLRKIPDGKWLTEESITSDELTKAIEAIKSARSRLNAMELKTPCDWNKLQTYFPEFEVGYDYALGVHFVEFESVQQQR